MPSQHVLVWQVASKAQMRGSQDPDTCPALPLKLKSGHISAPLSQSTATIWGHFHNHWLIDSNYD